MADGSPRPLDKTAIACSLLALGMGVFIVLTGTGVLPSRGGNDADRWIGLTVGFVFILGGLAAFIQTLVRASASGELPAGAPSWVRATLGALSFVIAASLAMIATGIAIGPGKRHFGGSMPFLSGHFNEVIGRTLFGAGALIIWALLIGFAVTRARKLLIHQRPATGTAPSN